MSEMSKAEQAVWELGIVPFEDIEQIVKTVVAALRELPELPGPRYSAGGYSRHNIDAFVDDVLGL